MQIISYLAHTLIHYVHEKYWESSRIPHVYTIRDNKCVCASVHLKMIPQYKLKIVLRAIIETKITTVQLGLAAAYYI